jgi:lysylphosphatidylglycerol synthetase-like protein (DUF2156 family)
MQEQNMFISAVVFMALAASTFYFAKKQTIYKRAETAQICSVIFLVCAVLFVAGGVWKWATA